MRRIVRPAFASTLVVLALSSFMAVFAAPAGAQADAESSAQSGVRCADPDGCIRALSVNGFLNDINVDFIEDAVTESERTDGYLAVIIVLDSPGSVVADDELQRLVERLRAATLPVSVWVGPSGAEVRGGAAELAAALPSTMAPNTEIGDVGQPRLTGDEFADLPTRTSPRLRAGTVGERAAVRLGVVDRVDPTLGDHVLEIDGVPSEVVEDDDGRPKRQLAAQPVTQKLPVTIQLLHTAASPGVAYLALGIAIGLLLFEFFTAGVGVAGLVGAGSAVMAAYGLAAMPIRTWALFLCLFSAFAFAVDIQTAIPRAWTAIGLVSWSIGSIFLFDGFRAPWLSLVTGLVGMAVTMLSGMPAMVRSRFATPTLGRDWMLGREGVAITAIDPEGTVEVNGGEWRAITNRATPVAEGEPLRVVGIDGLTLEIEPLEGGAVDYRERRSKNSTTANDS